MTAETPLKEIDTPCEMERLGLGSCRRIRDERDQYSYSIDAALRRIKYPWYLTAILSSHGSYGYFAIIDRASPSNMIGRTKNVESVYGMANTVPDAIARCIEQIDAIDAEIAAAPKSDPNDW